MKRAVCLFSGGKDSVFAAFWALFQGFELSLLTIKPEPYSMMFHHPNVEWTRLQAKAASIPHFIISAGKDELSTLQKTIESLHVDAIITGAIASEYQRQRIEEVGENLGLAVHSPLWHKTSILLNEMLENFEILITSVSAEGLGREYLGKPFRQITELNLNIHPFLEGGEAETFVTYAPFFKKRIVVKEWNIQWDGVRGVAEIKNAVLI